MNYTPVGKLIGGWFLEPTTDGYILCHIDNENFKQKAPKLEPEIDNMLRLNLMLTGMKPQPVKAYIRRRPVNKV